MCESSPAPDSTTASTPRAASFFATSGTSATRFSPWADWLGTPSFMRGAREDNEARGRSSAGRRQLHPAEAVRLAADAREEALAVGAVVGPGEDEELGADECGDVRVLVAEGVREAREGDDLVGALALREALPVGAQLALVEVVLADPAVNERAHVGGGGSVEQLGGDDRQVEVARIGPVGERGSLEGARDGGCVPRQGAPPASR